MRRTIAFLADSLADGFQQSVWAGVRKAAEELDLDLLCFLTGYIAHLQPGRRVFELLDPSRLTGIVALSGTLGPSESDLEAIYGRFAPVPLVGIGRAMAGVPGFLVDNEASISAVMDHLVEVHGRRAIAFVRGPETSEEAEARYAAYRASLARHGLPEDPARVLPGNFNGRTGMYAARALLEGGVRFDALLAANDYMALAAAEELVRHGLDVPRDVAVAGFDDVSEAMAFGPGLTSIRQPLFEMSREAVLQLLRAADGAPQPMLRRFPGELVVRGSCGCRAARVVPRPRPPAAGAAQAGALSATQLAGRLEARFPSLAVNVGDQSWALRLAEALLAGLAGDDPNPLCDAVAALERAGHTGQVEVRRWFEVLDAAAEELGAARPELEGRLLALTHAAYRSLGSTVEQVYKAAQIGLERDANVLRRVWQLNPVDPEEVWQALRDQLPNMGVPSFYLSSFVDPVRRLAQLDFQYSCSDSVALDPTPGPFPETQLVPGAFTTAHRHGFVVLPVKARGKECGFAVCEIGRMGGNGYESLASQLTAAIELRTLLGEVRGYATELEARIDVRTEQLREAQKQVADTAHRAGMAEIAVGLMHNVGNLLNSVSVSAERIVGLCGDPRLGGLVKTAELLEGCPDALVNFLVKEARAPLLAQYLRRSAEELDRERGAIRVEGREMLENVTLIRDTVKTLQEYARGERELMLHEALDLRAVVETALKVQQSTLSRHSVQVVRDLAPVPPVLAQRAKLVHILVNLVKNGIEAMQATPLPQRILTVRLRNGERGIELRVTDAGEGIPEANLLRVFSYGFTTKAGGHGFGLHTCANHVARMGGTIHAESEGPGKGASFVLRFQAAEALEPVA
ncbi:MAG TPA: substrate-binding domain-containing protein [Anaeromyxobacter sp.]|nr:substrate-binding domain-containing protein [Anaeromyxobacter sp.]